MKVKVSIIIPMYNSGSFIIEMINSIINQTYSDWELIIVDDISSDDTFKKVSNYIINEDRIKLFKRDRLPKGAQTCRNMGFENSIGEYVVFFDADDLISKNCLQQRVNFMEKNLELDFSIFPAHTINKSNEIFQTKSKRIYAKTNQTDNFGSLLKGEVPFAVWTNIYRRTSVSKMSWDEEVKVFQDFYFNFLAIINGLKFKYCVNAEFDYFYRVNSGENTITYNFIKSEKVVSTIYMFERVINKLSQRDDFLIRKKQLFNFCLIYFERLFFDAKVEDFKRFSSFLDKNYLKENLKLTSLITRVNYFNNRKLKRLVFALHMIFKFRSKIHFKLIFNLVRSYVSK